MTIQQFCSDPWLKKTTVPASCRPVAVRINEYGCTRATFQFLESVSCLGLILIKKTFEWASGMPNDSVQLGSSVVLWQLFGQQIIVLLLWPEHFWSTRHRLAAARVHVR